jgi:VWFA-related protein
VKYGVVGCALACLVLSSIPAVGQQAQEAPAEEVPSPETPVFTDEVEVNVVNVYVTVVDRQGKPVIGLEADDFVIKEDGQQVEITNFSDVGSIGAGLAEADEAPSAVGTAAERVTPQLALVFDNTSLERRQRRRVIKDLEPWIDKVTGDGGQVMVATIDPELDIVQPFTSDASFIGSALEWVVKEPSAGDSIKSSKRMLRRDMQAASTVNSQPMLMDLPNTSGGSGGGSGGSPGGGTSSANAANAFAAAARGSQQANQFLGQIELIRRQEYGRLGMSLSALERLIRGLNGLPGRKDVLWIGEDLVMQPGVDVYRAFFTKFSSWSRELNLDQPEIWGSELELRREFEYLAAVAQASSVVVHSIDASDRDLEVAAADFRASDQYSHATTDPRGTGATGGYDLAQFRQSNEGSQYMAGATGGSFLGGSRNFDDYFARLADLVGAYYSIGYRRPGPPDGQLHSIAVDVPGKGLQVRTHERIPNPTRDQRLADMAISRLMIGEGTNALDLRLLPGSAEATDDRRFIQEVAIAIPSNALFVQLQNDLYVGHLSVVLISNDAEGTPTPPRMMEMDMTIPPDKLNSPTLAMARLRLMMEAGATRVAVAVRDEGSGSTASALLEVEGPPMPESGS